MAKRQTREEREAAVQAESAPKGLMTPAPLPTGALPTLYGTEDAAWIALAVILGESI